MLIDRAVMLDCHRGKRNLSMAWIDVRKAYDSVDHDWLCAMTDVHRLPVWLGEVIRKLCASWNTKVVATTRQGREASRQIKFMKGLPQGDALCPRLFTLCLNPVAYPVEGSPSARRVWYEDGRDSYHHGSWGKTLQIRGGARERSTG